MWCGEEGGSEDREEEEEEEGKRLIFWLVYVVASRIGRPPLAIKLRLMQDKQEIAFFIHVNDVNAHPLNLAYFCDLNVVFEVDNVRDDADTLPQRISKSE
jgi:hypothetical protein